MDNAVEHNISTNEELNAARNVVEALLKTRKTLRIYPRSNPIYIKNLEDIFDKFKDFFNYTDKLILGFSQNDIYYNSESVYKNPQKLENLALLFFKHGVREITFSKDVTCEEIEDFLEITATDFNNELVEDDVVTLLWQRNFAHIEYHAEDIILTDEEVNELDTINESRQRPSDPSDLKRAYYDSLEEEGIPSSVPIIPLTTDDYEQLSDILGKDNEEKLSKYFNMLFEIFHDVERSVEYEDIVYFFMKSIEYSIKNSNFQLMTDVLVKFKKIIDSKDTDSIMRKSAIKILLFVSGKKMIGIIGDILDKEEKIEKEVFQNYISLLDQNAISPLINLLGDLQSINAKTMIMDALTRLVLKDTSKPKIDPKDISRLIQGLKHSQWYVVSKIIYILSQIGDENVIEYIKKTVKHEDYRVRREAVSALGELGKDNVLSTIRECLDDEDIKVRKAALVAIGNIATNSAKKIIMGKISKSLFVEKELNEKKEYFGILAQWNDKNTYDFCIRTITKKTFWKKSKHYETKACAIYSLGLIGDKNALPVLNKCKTSRNKLLYEFSDEAIKRIENGG